MSNYIKHISALIAAFFVFSIVVNGQNSINGIVLDNERRPVSRMDVELLDEFERLLKTTQTAGSGLYFFQGLKQGNYYVQVRVDGTGFLPAKERIQLGQGNRTTSTGLTSGAETVQINFNLQPRRSVGTANPTRNEVVFAQDVPDAARASFDRAAKLLEDKKTNDGLKALEDALAIFPSYYLALDRLGYEYLNLGRFVDAEMVFIRELKVNEKSVSARSGLGVAQYKLEKKTDAVVTLERAVIDNPSSANSHLFLGKIYRDLKQFEKAETALTKARSLDPKNPDIHWELALLYYYDLKKPADAAEELERYLKANPKAANRPQIEKLIKTIRSQKVR